MLNQSKEEGCIVSGKASEVFAVGEWSLDMV